LIDTIQNIPNDDDDTVIDDDNDDDDIPLRYFPINYFISNGINMLQT
jgi:hypothetical protein